MNDFEDIRTSLVHMAPDELNALDDMQGGPSIDPIYGIREYRQLSGAFDDPGVQDIFREVSRDYHDDGKLSPSMERLYTSSRQMLGEPHPYEKAPGEEKPPISTIEHDSARPDIEMALLPDNMVKFFITLEGGKINTNPETGLLRFGGVGSSMGNFTKSIIRTGATIGGAMMAGPLGAGLGNMAGRALTGQKFGSDMVMGGLKNAAYTGLGQMALGATGLGGAMQGMMPAAMAPYTAGLFAPGAGMAGALGGMSGGEQGLLASARQSAGLAPAAGGAAGIMGSMGNMQTMLPLAAMALAWKGQNQQHDDEMKAHAEERRRHDEWAENMGIYRPFNRRPALNRVRNPKYVSNQFTPDEPIWIEKPEDATIGYKAHGGLIQGPGDGTADKIKTSVPDGSFILSADVVSKFGNGSSTEGAKRLNEYFNNVPSPQGSSLMASGGINHSSSMVPVYLSNDEYCVPSDKVTALGGGSNKKGSAMLHNLMKNIRLQKNKSGGKLPPDAHSPSHYMKGS